MEEAQEELCQPPPPEKCRSTQQPVNNARVKASTAMLRDIFKDTMEPGQIDALMKMVQLAHNMEGG